MRTGSNSNAMAQQAVNKGYVKSVGEYNNAVTAGQSGAKYGYSRTGNSVTANNSKGKPITATDLQDAALIDVPTPVVGKNEMPTVLANNMALGVTPPVPNTDATTTTTADTTATTNTSVSDYFKSAIGIAPPDAPESGADAYLKAQKDLGIKQKQQEVSNYTAQLNAITAKAQAESLGLEGQGRGITESIIGGQQAQISREAAIQALPVQAQLAAAQGNLEMANKTLDTYYQIKSQDIQNKFNYEMKLYDSVMSYIDKKEQNIIEDKRQQAQFKQQKDMAYLDFDLAKKKEAINFNNSLALRQFDVDNREVSTSSATTVAESEKQLSLVNDISNVLGDTNFDRTFGWANMINRNNPQDDAYKTKANIQTIIDQAALASRGQLKGQGAVSDFEGKMLKNAATSLTLNLKPAAARQELIKIQGAIRTSSGLSTSVKITSPSGEVKYGTADSTQITEAIKSGYTVTYQ